MKEEAGLIPKKNRINQRYLSSSGMMFVAISGDAEGLTLLLLTNDHVIVMATRPYS